MGAWDADGVHQVLLNLLTNAIKYASGEEIVLRVAERKDVAEVAVRAHGLGIPREDRPHLFERFDRAGRTETTPAKGMDLGLYSTTAIIEAHDGRIWVQPTHGGVGTFIFALP